MAQASRLGGKYSDGSTARHETAHDEAMRGDAQAYMENTGENAGTAAGNSKQTSQGAGAEAVKGGQALASQAGTRPMPGKQTKRLQRAHGGVPAEGTTSVRRPGPKAGPARTLRLACDLRPGPTRSPC